MNFAAQNRGAIYELQFENCINKRDASIIIQDPKISLFKNGYQVTIGNNIGCYSTYMS